MRAGGRLAPGFRAKNITLCALEPVLGGDHRIFANIDVTSDYKNIRAFIENLKMKFGTGLDYDIECGYETGCLEYSLYNQLTAIGVICIILTRTQCSVPKASVSRQSPRCPDDRSVPGTYVKVQQKIFKMHKNSS